MGERESGERGGVNALKGVVYLYIETKGCSIIRAWELV